MRDIKVFSLYPHILIKLKQFWLACLLVCLILGFAVKSYAHEADAWDALKSGNHFALIRHAIAPGTGDPSSFKIGDCSTQRNLSNKGKQQAVIIGELFRANGIDKAAVFSSQWCRCFETAELLKIRPIQPLPTLNSFFQNYDREALQTQMLKDWLAKQDLTKPLVLVTHQVNITALTNIYPASGEIIVVQQTKYGQLKVVGRLQTD